ncbi:helix-turn-helix domain-containing protein [Agrococcus versicolor]|uniref:Helix-turn-helix domain-containing protein n=2 Tax=Agrococcus versicolor TaxID=501482 RepID=A0ABN3AUZ6_9MICO
MNSERSDLEARAARHAALADPARLRIVDLLTLSDLSPRELQDRLGMASNLIAHHLGVLERERMIVRTRSEGDRRRSYVHLTSAASEGLGPSASAAARRVVFVCTGNSARSQLAAALWRQRSEIPAASAGTKPAERVSPGAIAVAERHGLDLAGATPQHVQDVMADTDFIVTVCDAAHEVLERGAELHWSVPAPGAAGTDAAYDAAFDDLAARVDVLAERLAPA